MSQANPRARDREALFVRIPRREAQRLDRAAFELRRSKQDLVSGLVARYVDPASPASMAALRVLAAESAEGDAGRVSTAPGPVPLPVGRAELTPSPESTGEVLTLAGAALLLQAEEDEIARLAEAGELPGRRIGGRWRFARAALLDWLGGREG